MLLGARPPRAQGSEVTATPGKQREVGKDVGGFLDRTAGWLQPCLLTEHSQPAWVPPLIPLGANTLAPNSAPEWQGSVRRVLGGASSLTP